MGLIFGFSGDVEVNMLAVKGLCPIEIRRMAHKSLETVWEVERWLIV